MIAKVISPIVMVGVIAATVGSAIAHTPLCACYDNGDGTVLCEGGFSDGSSAAGVRIYVSDKSGNIVIDASMDENSEFIFDKPDGKFTVMFDAGEGHRIEITGDDIY
ncbi:hypothetical protein [Tropicimonas marinistellae]|uniref:hypothetical protein n=1 Tax=Tropicimonas marinistellae TaxID=1739787 RepID=UPI0008344335|nr:hypothetical protein [Tropicimonas marinistellae]